MTEAMIMPGTATAVSYDPGAMTFDEWQEVGRVFRQFHNSVLWWIGDWLQYGRGAWGEMYSQAMESTDYSYEMLRRAYAVAEVFEPGRRRPNLSWSHHREVMYESADKQDLLLDLAESEGWSATDLRDEIQESKPKKIRDESHYVDRDTSRRVEEWSRERIGQTWTTENHDELLVMMK